jgi:hypothetical protein
MPTNNRASSTPPILNAVAAVFAIAAVVALAFTQTLAIGLTAGPALLLFVAANVIEGAEVAR